MRVYRGGLEFLTMIVVFGFVLYPGIFEFLRDVFGVSSTPLVVVEVALPAVVGLVIGKYWAAGLAINQVVWFFVDLARGHNYAASDWHSHTGLQVVALALYTLLTAFVIAVGVWIRRRWRPPVGQDRVGARLAKIRRSWVFSARVTWREMLPFIAVAAAFWIPTIFTSGMINLTMWIAGVAAYFGGVIYLRRRAAKSA